MYTEFNKMSDRSRVWVYPTERDLSSHEEGIILGAAKDFVEKWTAHNLELHASCEILENRFLVLTVDETTHGASGCSIDSSVHFVKELEKSTGISFLNGGKVALSLESGIALLTTGEVRDLSLKSNIDENTVVYNHLVKDIGELRSNFKTTAGTSWLKRFLIKEEA